MTEWLSFLLGLVVGGLWGYRIGGYRMAKEIAPTIASLADAIGRPEKAAEIRKLAKVSP